MALPDITLPPWQGHSVRVSLINAARTHIPASMLVEPMKDAPIPRYLNLACFSFLIESEHCDKKFLFDLGMMEDVHERMPPALKILLTQPGDAGGIDEQRQVDSVLQEHGINLDAIDGIILSHGHLDQIGDPSVFPPDTELVVGPGFKQDSRFMPGYPIDPEGLLLSSVFEGRHTREVEFKDDSIMIGGLPAVDFLEDGSLYLLHAPGHTPHHMMALARTTADSWVLMAGDTCHSVAQLRPTKLRPLPEDVPASVLGKESPPERYSCAHIQDYLLEGTSGPLYGTSVEQHLDRKTAIKTAKTTTALDECDDVMVFLAHDVSVLGVVDEFPAPLNEWKANGWAEQSHWKFLQEGIFETT